MKQNKLSSNIFEQSSLLVTYFKDMYLEKYGKKLIVNRFKTKYYFLDVLQDNSLEEVKRLIKHYFHVGGRGTHSIKDFLECYDELEKNMSEYSDDVEERRRLRKITQDRVEKYRRGEM